MNYYIKSLLYSVVIIKLSESEVNIQLESVSFNIIKKMTCTNSSKKIQNIKYVDALNDRKNMK